MAAYWDDNDTDIPLTEVGPPELLLVEPIQSCSLRCRMCHVSDTEMSHERLSPDFVEKYAGLEGGSLGAGGGGLLF